MTSGSWNLDNGNYNFSFDFSASVQSKSYLQTHTGKIIFHTDSDEIDGHNTEISTFYIELWKGADMVERKNANRVGSTTVTFTGLANETDYYFKFTKARDNVQLAGSGYASQS